MPHRLSAVHIFYDRIVSFQEPLENTQAVKTATFCPRCTLQMLMFL